MFVDYENTNLFSNSKAQPNKNIWKLLGKFVQGKTNKSAKMNKLVVLRTWKKQINSAFTDLKSMAK